MDVSKTVKMQVLATVDCFIHAQLDPFTCNFFYFSQFIHFYFANLRSETTTQSFNDRLQLSLDL